MTRSARRTLAAALATGLALAVLVPVLHGSDWMVRGLGAIGVVAAAGLAGRAGRLPRALQPLLGLLVLVAYLLLVFVHGTLHHGLPSGDTVDALRSLVRSGTQDVRRYAPPLVPGRGLLLLTTAGIGGVALLVDLLAATLDRVVLSGLPLLALFAVPSSVLPGGIGGLAFVVGASGWLLLLLEEGGDRTEQWGRLMRSTVPGAKVSADDGSQARVGRRLSAAALGLAVVVPTVLPGLDHQLAGSGLGDGKGTQASSATTYNPITRLRDELTLPTPRQLFVYTSDDPAPDYLRMTTLDTYTGSGWQSSQLQADPTQARVQKGIAPDVGEDGPTQDVTMRLAVDGDHLDVHWLPLPYGPRHVDVEGTWLWDPTSQTVFSASRTTRDLPPYDVRAQRALPTRDALAGAGTSYPPAVSRYLAPLVVSDSVKQLARRITKGMVTPYEQAIAIQEWFTNPTHGYVYDLTPSQPVPGQDALDAFLEGKHGFCQQYATAMAVLLRVSGVPSRVAVGFTPGQQVSRTARTWSVTTSDAHAWPEAYFPGTGWVRFEPTPPGAVAATTPDYTLPSAPGSHGGPGPSPTPSATASAGPRQFKDPDKLLTPVPTGGPGSGGAAASHRSQWALLALALLVLAVAPGTGTRLRRRARARRQDPLVAWEQLRDDVLDTGHDWHPADTPRTTVAGLAPALPADAGAALHRLAQAVELTRYAPAGRAGSADVVADGTAVRRALLASAPLATRWRARLLTPSTLHWAAHTASERVADVLDAVDRGLAWAGRPFRRVLRTG